MPKPIFVRLVGVIRRQGSELSFEPSSGVRWMLVVPAGYRLSSRFLEVPVIVEGADEGSQRLKVHRVMPLGHNVDRPVRVKAR